MLKSCKHNHIFDKDKYKRCPTCKKIRLQNWRLKNKDKVSIQNKTSRLNNIEKLRKKDKLRYENNKEYFSQKNKLWKKLNRDKNCYNANMYYCRKINAVPNWLTEEHKNEIKIIYNKAKQLSNETGEQYQVDHIIPLNHPNVCGLHVPWNLQILKKIENIKKSNKLEIKNA